MPLSAAEQAFAEGLIIDGLVPGTKLAYALKVKEAQKKHLAQVLVDLKLVTQDEARRIWKIGEAALKAAPAPTFAFSEGAMMGPYELVEPRGSFLAGTHWRAKRPEGMGLLRLVPPGTGQDQDRAQRLIDRANAGVDPPDETILRVDDAGEEFNWLYVGSLGVDGRSLAQRLLRGPLPEAEAIVLARTAARALACAHGLGVTHGGLSTLAVIYLQDGTPRLTDFGVGSVFFDGPPAGMPPGLRLGLLLYAAPELIRGGHEHGLDARADLFALGGLLADAVSPAAGNGMKAPESDPWLVQPLVSDGLLAVLRRLLAAELDERYPSADALLQDLERVAAGGLPGPLPPPGPPLLVASRPETALPLALVTAELLSGGAPVAEPSPEPSEPSEPEPEAEAEPDADEIPKTDDPDSKAGMKRGLATESERTKAKRKRPSQRLGRGASTKVEAAERKSHGLDGFLFSVLLVVGGSFGARAATAPDPASKAKLELARAHLLAAKDHDYKGADDAIAAAREAAGQNAPLVAEVLATEASLRERRIAEYLEARRKKTWADQAPRLVEGTDLDCLRALDAAKRDAAGDAKVWQRIGLDCLKAGFAEDAQEALTVAAQRDSSFAKDRELGARAAALGAFLPAGSYPKTTIKKALYVGAREVTRDEYARWLDEATRAGTLHARCSPKEPKDKSHAPQGWDPAFARAARDRRPATGVDWFDAFACARALGGRLPTRAELEAAATGRVARTHPWGEHAFHAALANAAEAFDKQLLPVGSLFGGASPCGAFDLLGNAEEWCAPESDDAAQAPVFGGDAGTHADKLVLGAETLAAPLEERAPLRGFRAALEIE